MSSAESSFRQSLLRRVSTPLFLFLSLLLVPVAPAYAQQLNPAAIASQLNRFFNGRLPSPPPAQGYPSQAAPTANWQNAAPGKLSDAPSINCVVAATKGRSAVGQILCDGPDGAAADWDLNAVLWALAGSMDQTAQRAFDKEQDRWRARLNERCQLPKSAFGISTAQKQCTLGEFHARAAVLRLQLTGDALTESRLAPEQHAELQTALISRRLLGGLPDGEFGNDTRVAIKRFQEANGTAPTGFLTKDETAILLQNASPAVPVAESAPPANAATENSSAAKNDKQDTPQTQQTKPIKNADVSGKSLVGDYIIAHGSCAALSRSWESEFHRPDRAPPYGKPFLDWDQEDFSVLRKWVDRCLDPYLVQRGYREQSLQIYDSTVRRYQREQESARAENRQQQQLAAGGQTRLQTLIAQYDSARTRTQEAIEDFERKAVPFLDQTKSLQIANIDGVMELGREAASLGAKAKDAVSDASTASSNLQRFAQAGVQRPILDNSHTSEATSQQIGAAFERVQREYAQVETALQRIQQMQARRQRCSQRLSDAGVPKPIIETKIFSANGDQDNYFFEVICPTSSARLVYSGPNQSSQMFEFELGNTPVRLWFDLRDDDGSKMWSQQANGDPTPTSRLVLRRVSAGSTDESAEANWESVNLLNTAVLLLTLSR